MKSKLFACACVVLALSFMLTGISYSAPEKETAGAKTKKFWQKLFNYPANVTNESATVVSDTVKRGTEVATKEVKTVGQVTSGEVAKTKELVTEPITGTAETMVKAVEGTVAIPANAAKEEPQAVQPPAEQK